MLTPGAHVGRYELVCPLGEGGMAQVWVARQRGSRAAEIFALKSIQPRFADDPAFRAMFLDEARIATAIDHPNVARVLELGAEGSLLYLVMEYVDGESLSSLLVSAATREERTSATVPPGVALRIVADVCAGLHAAHRVTDRDGRLRGVVHRDVSPANILLDVQGAVKLIDFGIAHASGRASADTSAGSVKGKLHYVAPEQALGRPVGPHTDVFGAGATLYKMLTGRPPYEGGNDAATLALLMSGARAAALPDAVPPRIATLVQRALAVDPRDRFASAEEMATALEAALATGEYPADVAAWVGANLSARVRARRALLVDADAAEPAQAPGFMDVHALVARAAVPDLPASSSPAKKPASEADDDEDRPVEGKPFRPAVVGDGTVPRRSRVSPRALAIGAGLVGLLAGTAVLVAPGIVKSRAIAEARDAGVEVEIGTAAVGLAGITLHDVRARIPSIPEVAFVRCDDLEVLGFFSAREIRIRNLDASITGPLSDVSSKLLDFANRNRRRIAGTPSAPHRFTVLSGRATWNDLLGPNTQLQAGQLGLDLDSRGAGLEEIRATVARFDVTTPKTTIGPWAFAYDRNAQSARARVLFDPPLMDGPSALLVWSQPGAKQVVVRVPRSPFANLGVKPSELGLPADASSELEATIEAEEGADGAVVAKAHVDLWSARVKGISGPTDIHADARASGTVGRPLELEKTSVTLGPFVATVNGEITLHPTGFRVDATWRTAPIACATLARAEATKMGPIVEAIQDIAHRTGAARVTGNANASGLLRYDTANPAEVSTTWTTRDTCGLSLFGL